MTGQDEQNENDVINGLLDAAKLPEKASYTRAEVCRLLSISPRTFWTMVNTYEPDEDGSPVHPATLDSYMLRGHRRVPYNELSNFVRRNRTYDRRHGIYTQPELPFD